MWHPKAYSSANIEGQCVPSVRHEFANASVQERLHCEILLRRHLDEDQPSIRVIKRVRNNEDQRPTSLLRAQRRNPEHKWFW